MSTAAPVWDLQSYFPAFESPERISFSEQLTRDLESLLSRASALEPLFEENTKAWVGVIQTFEDVWVRFSHLASYLNALVSTHTGNEEYQAADAAHSKLGAELSKVRTELMRGLRVASNAELELLLGDKALRGAEWFVRRMHQESSFQMQAHLEALAADLGVDGISAWGRLYSNLTGKLSFRMKFPDGHEEEVAMSRRRGLMANGDRAIRKEAFYRGNEVWAAHETTLAAGLNAIAGTRLTLNQKRGVQHFLDVPLFDSGMERETLDAMHAGIESSVEVLHAALRAGAVSLGLERMDWCDLEAPMPSWGGLVYSWEEGTKLLEHALDRTYPAFADYYREALRDRWVEAEERDGKLPGAYCTGSTLVKQERIYMTYMGSINDLMTLAHEFGHAWHSHLIEKAHRPLAASYPMTLAETASTFGEALFVEGISRDPACPEALRSALLDVEANRLHSFLVNIPVRFAFEKSFYEERAQGEVPVSRIKALMEEAQRKYYGEALGETDPYFWASKLHFFITEVAFYNFPYAFGYLLSRALFVRFKAEGRGFLKNYEAFLCNTGSMTCEEAAKQALGVNLKDPMFWAAAVKG